MSRAAFAQQPRPSPAPPVFAAETNIVHVDAVVTDRKGKQVTDLTAADFEIESKGQRYPATIATYISLVDDAPELQAAARKGMKLRPEDVKRAIAFLVARPIIETEGGNDPESETINMGSNNRAEHMASSRGVDQMFERFITRSFKPGDLVAFLNADSRKPLLSQFTADRDALELATAAFRKDILNPGATPVILGPAGNEPLVRYCLYTLELAREIVDRLKELPGRKMLFVTAGVLRITGPGFEIVGQEAEHLVEQANRVGVTIYGINPSGLTRRRSEALGYLAAGTGGSTIERTPFPADDLEKIMELNRGYYLVGYNPGEAPSALVHRIKVHLRREGLTVAARPQVYAKASPVSDAPPDGMKPALETLLNAPLTKGALRVRLTPYVRWKTAKTGEFLAVVDIDPKGIDLGPDPPSPTVDIEAVARVTDQRGVVLKAHRVRIARPLNETGPDPLHFVVRTPLPSPGIYQVDVALHDNRSGQRGDATGIASLPDISQNKRPLLASTLAMTDVEPAGANPEQRFRPDSVVTLSCVVANARRAARSREAQIEIRMRILKEGQVVLDLGPETLRQELPELIDLKGKVSLSTLAAGDYVAEVKLTDLLAEKGRNAVTLTAQFSVELPQMR